METTGSATSPNTTLWLHISIHVQCGFLAPQLQRVFSSFLPLPLQQSHNTRTTSTTEVSLHYPKQGMIIMENPSKLPATCAACFMLDPPPVKKWVPILWSLTVATHNGKATPQPSLHTPLHSSSNGKAAASSRLKGLCRELPNALRTPLRGRRFLKKQHPQACRFQRLGVGEQPIPDFFIFWTRVRVAWIGWQGLKAWEFSPIVVEKPAFWFPGWRYSLDGWLELCWKSILSNMVKSGTIWRLSGGSWWIETLHHPEWYQTLSPQIVVYISRCIYHSNPHGKLRRGTILYSQ